MFELTKKSEYGLQLMVYLAKKTNRKPVSLKKVARDKKMPYRFLSRVAAKLKEAGLLGTKEGVTGGFFLAKPAKKIHVSDILEVLEGKIEMVNCLQSANSCPWASSCHQRKMFQQLTGSVRNIFQAHTLADLAV